MAMPAWRMPAAQSVTPAVDFLTNVTPDYVSQSARGKVPQATVSPEHRGVLHSARLSADRMWQLGGI